MKRTAALLLTLALLISAARADDPAAVTKAVYQTALAHFGFGPDTLKIEKPYFAPELYAALLKKAQQPVPKGDAPDIEGDILFDAQDVPDKYVVGPATIDGPKAQVPLSLRWGDEKRRYLVHLTQLDGTWKIGEIDYGKDGKLSDLLK